MDGVGHGTVLAGRYRLEERLRSETDWSLWRGVDQRLERSVTIHVQTGPRGEETLDAARRAALVEDARLLRVLDAGQTRRGAGSALTYVVSEAADGTSLARLVAAGPLPAAQVRAMVGEAAAALEVARLSGLHHGMLRPSALTRTPAGAVRVAGLAVAVAAQGAPEGSAEESARDDTVSLVALLYAGLTGRWPFGSVDGLLAAPLVAGRPVPPADLVPGVPSDLDTLCAVTFGPHQDGPRSPGELATQLAPWTGAGLVATGRAGVEPAAMRPAAQFPARLEPGVPADALVPAEVPADRPGDGLGILSSPGPARDVRTDAQPSEAELAARAGQSRTALVLVALLLVLGLALSIRSLSSIGDGSRVAREPPATSTPSPTTPLTPSPSVPATTAGPSAPVVAGVRTLDPSGDGENDETAPRAIDDDPASFWSSSTYASAQFGGLKDGLGLVVALTEPSQVSGVTVTANGAGGSVELRTAPGPGLEGSTVLAAGEIVGGPVDLAPPEPALTQYLIVWFTRLPQTGAGYRVELTQVQVR